MSIADKSEAGAKVEHDRLCPAGQLAHAYLNTGVATKKDRRRRARRAVMFAAQTAFAMSTEDIALAFNIDARFVSRELAEAKPEIKRAGMQAGVWLEQASPALMEMLVAPTEAVDTVQCAEPLVDEVRAEEEPASDAA